MNQLLVNSSGNFLIKESEHCMKALIIYHSVYRKNTEMIAKIFAQRLSADLLTVEEGQTIDLNQYELIGFGSGVYRESMSKKLLDHASKLNLRDKDFFVFSTSGAGMKSYNKKLIKILNSKGGRCKGSFACKGSFVSEDFTKNKIFKFFSRFAKGHPDSKDIKKAEVFIDNMIRKVGFYGND